MSALTQDDVFALVRAETLLTRTRVCVWRHLTAYPDGDVAESWTAMVVAEGNRYLVQVDAPDGETLLARTRAALAEYRARQGATEDAHATWAAMQRAQEVSCG